MLSVSLKRFADEGDGDAQMQRMWCDQHAMLLPSEPQPRRLLFLRLQSVCLPA
jgi:hypothetical protein